MLHGHEASKQLHYHVMNQQSNRNRNRNNADHSGQQSRAIIFSGFSICRRILNRLHDVRMNSEIRAHILDRKIDVRMRGHAVRVCNPSTKYKIRNSFYSRNRNRTETKFNEFNRKKTTYRAEAFQIHLMD